MGKDRRRDTTSHFKRHSHNAGELTLAMYTSDKISRSQTQHNGSIDRLARTIRETGIRVVRSFLDRYNRPIHCTAQQYQTHALSTNNFFHVARYLRGGACNELHVTHDMP